MNIDVDINFLINSTMKKTSNICQLACVNLKFPAVVYIGIIFNIEASGPSGLLVWQLWELWLVRLIKRHDTAEEDTEC